MPTLTEDPRVAYIPTPEEIEAHTAKYRAAHLKKKLREGQAEKRAARRRQIAKRKRAMTKADICNVEFAPVLDDLLSVFRMLSDACQDELDALENDDARWAVAGKEVE